MQHCAQQVEEEAIGLISISDDSIWTVWLSFTIETLSPKTEKIYYRYGSKCKDFFSSVNTNDSFFLICIAL